MNLSNALSLAAQHGTVEPFGTDQYIVAAGPLNAIVFRVKNDRVVKVVHFQEEGGKVQGARCRTLTAATRRLGVAC